MASNEEAILKFTIKIDTELTPNTQKNINELEEKKQKEKDAEQEKERKVTESLDFAQEERDLDPDHFDALKNAIHQSTEEAVDQAINAKLPDELFDALNNLDENAIEKIFGKLKNPQATLLDALDAVLPVKAQAILKLALEGGGAIFVATEIIKILEQKGGPLDRTWRRFLDQEIDAGLDRRSQKLRELGFNQTILPQQVGFIPNNENWTFNSLFAVNESRIARIGLSDKAAGVLTR